MNLFSFLQARTCCVCLVLFLLLLISSTLRAQEVEWTEFLGNADRLSNYSDGNVYGYKVATDQEGNAYVAGVFEGKALIKDVMLQAEGKQDLFLAKLNAAGNLQWVKRLGGLEYEPQNEYLTALHVDEQGFLYLTASIRTSSVSYDTSPLLRVGNAFLLKVDATTGELLWSHSAQVESYEGVVSDSQGSIYLTGAFTGRAIVGDQTLCSTSCRTGSGFTNYDILTVKLDRQGKVVWAKHVGGEAESVHVRGKRLGIDARDRLYVAGSFSGTVAFQTAVLTASDKHGDSSLLLAYEPDGTERWVRQMSPGLLRVGDLAVDALGNSYAAGVVSAGINLYNGMLHKYSPDGGLLWEKRIATLSYQSDLQVEIDHQQQPYLYGMFGKELKLDDFQLVNSISPWGVSFVAKMSALGKVQWAKVFQEVYSEETSAFAVDRAIYLASSFPYHAERSDSDYSNNAMRVALMRVRDTSEQARGAWGRIMNDVNRNCSADAHEPGLKGRRLRLEPGSYVAETDAQGVWSIDKLPAGTYTMMADTSGGWRSACTAPLSFTISSATAFVEAPAMGLYALTSCAQPDISIQAPFLRRCFSEQKVYVNACNLQTATGALTAAYADVRLDPLLVPQSATLPYTKIDEHTYRFQLGNLNPGQCRSFVISCQLSCEAVLNQTLCLEASLYPIDPCMLAPKDPEPEPPKGVSPCTTPWDKSSLQVKGVCQDNNLLFTVLNTGEPGGGDMSCYRPVRLYVDGVYVQLDSVKLAGGERRTFSFAGDGRTWRLEADQHPRHPGKSRPNATVERCGNAANWTPNLVTALPQDDADPVIDSYCGLVTGSYDPNDKTGYPLGVGEQHSILPNSNLEYRIRFQNTGTDTAFTVVIRDTLRSELNVFSVRPGAASHPYTFRMYGQRVLEWTFSNILLPDSTRDEPGSHGFVVFTVAQNSGLADGTEIRNAAAIYFDYNEPILTNQTLHTINRSLQRKDWEQEEEWQERACQYFSLHGYTYTHSGIYVQKLKQPSASPRLIRLDLTIDQEPEVQLSQQESQLQATLIGGATYQWVRCDADATAIAGATAHHFSPGESGRYAVVVSQGACSTTTDCLFVNAEVLHSGEDPLENGHRIFPNPSRDKLYIQFAHAGQSARVKLWSLSGALLLEKDSPQGQPLRLDLEQQQPGLYLLEIIQGGQVNRSKLLKQ